MHKKCRKTCHAFCKRIKMFKHYLWMNKYSELCSRFKAIFLCFCDCITNTVIHLCHPLKLVSSLVLVTNPEPRIVNPSDIKAGKIRHLLGKCIIPCQKRIGSNNSHPTEIVVIKLLFPPTPVSETENSFFWLRLRFSSECQSQLKINLP